MSFFSEFAQITVDDLKKALVTHLWYEENNCITSNC